MFFSVLLRGRRHQSTFDSAGKHATPTGAIQYSYPKINYGKSSGVLKTNLRSIKCLPTMCSSLDLNNVDKFILDRKYIYLFFISIEYVHILLHLRIAISVGCLFIPIWLSAQVLYIFFATSARLIRSLSSGLFHIGFFSKTIRSKGIWQRPACLTHSSLLFYIVFKILGQNWGFRYIRHNSITHQSTHPIF